MIRQKCIDFAKRPQGVSASELAVPRSTASVNLRKLAAAGILFKAGTHMEMRYFDTQERANSFRAITTIARAPVARSRVPMGHKKKPTRAGWGPGDPVVITSETKVTIAPTPPRSLWTNTHARF